MFVQIGTATIVYFNPLPRKRENTVVGMNKASAVHFNPLPRKRENQQPLGTSTNVETISIHSLVRGRTFAWLFPQS